MTAILRNYGNYLPAYTASYFVQYGDGKFKSRIISLFHVQVNNCALCNQWQIIISVTG